MSGKDKTEEVKTNLNGNCLDNIILKRNNTLCFTK